MSNDAMEEFVRLGFDRYGESLRTLVAFEGEVKRHLIGILDERRKERQWKIFKPSAPPKGGQRQLPSLLPDSTLERRRIPEVSIFARAGAAAVQSPNAGTNNREPTLNPAHDPPPSQRSPQAQLASAWAAVSRYSAGSPSLSDG